MEQVLRDRLDRWHKKIDDLSQAESVCLQLEANEKSMYASLFLDAKGKNNAEREANAYITPEWRDFQSGLVAARVEYNKLRRQLELAQAAFNAEYLSSKNDANAINRTPKALGN